MPEWSQKRNLPCTRRRIKVEVGAGVGPEDVVLQGHEEEVGEGVGAGEEGLEVGGVVEVTEGQESHVANPGGDPSPVVNPRVDQEGDLEVNLS